MNARVLLSEIAGSMAHLLLPRLCAACYTPLLKREDVLCMGCTFELPQTGFHHIADNEAALRLAGRVPFLNATAFAYFTPDGLLQHLLHLLKYKGRQDVGLFLGRQAGFALQQLPWIQSLEAIVPIPLHSRKKAARGYNQTVLIAQGLSEVLSIPVFSDTLIRFRHTASQTLMSREERVQNVSGAFQLSGKTPLDGKHILLLDDVLTTGATLEAASLTCMEVPELKLSVFTIGLAMM